MLKSSIIASSLATSTAYMFWNGRKDL